jgi:hypothetical protein
MGWGAAGWVGLIDFLAQNEMEKLIRHLIRINKAGD